MMEKRLNNLFKLRDAYDEKHCVMVGELRKLAAEFRKVVVSKDSYDEFPDDVETLSIGNDRNGKRVLFVGGTLYGSRGSYRSASIELPLEYVYADEDGQKAYLAELSMRKQQALDASYAVARANTEAAERAAYEVLKAKFG